LIERLSIVVPRRNTGLRRSVPERRRRQEQAIALKDEIVRDHAEALREAYAEWPEDALPDPNATAMQSVAHRILRHAGLLHRYTADPKVLDHFLQLPPEERRCLAIAACSAIDTKPLMQLLVSLAESDDGPDDEEVLYIESALLTRDGLGAAVETAELLTLDLISKPSMDFPLLQALGYAQGALNMLDQAFEANRGATLAAMSIFDGLKPLIAVPIELEQWWLQDGAAILEAEEEGHIVQQLQPSSIRLKVDEAAIADEPPQEAEIPMLLAADGGSPVERRIEGVTPPASWYLVRVGDSLHIRVSDEDGKLPEWAQGATVSIKSLTGGESLAAPLNDRGEASFDAARVSPQQLLSLHDRSGSLLDEFPFEV